jgi:putative addiction module component (TIGR02574 family)
MNAAVQKILDEALSLPDDARAELVGRLIDSLDSGIDEDAQEAWDREIEHRIGQLDRNEVDPIPWPEARDQIIRGVDGQGSR